MWGKSRLGKVGKKANLIAIMASVPKKVLTRLADGIKRFQPIIQAAKARDAGESDTVTIITDCLTELFGYDKYSEVTSEHAIRGTYVDLAVKVDDKLLFLIECKAIGLTLTDKHLKQAVDYAANKGVDWVVLTNGHIWRIYKVSFTKPINQELIAEVDFLSINHKKEEELERLFVLCKEGWQKSAIQDLYGQSQMLSRYTIGAAILSEPVLEAIRRELRKAFPDAGLVDVEVISSILSDEVMRREVLEGDNALQASKKLARGVARNQKQKSEKKEDAGSPPPASGDASSDPA
jgi:hypothetical protein